MATKRRRTRSSPAIDKVLKHHRDLLGNVPDRVVAERAQVSLGTVRNARRSLGITAAHLSGRTKRAPKTTVAAAAPSSASWVWRVTYGSETDPQQGFVVAASPLNAVKAMQRVDSGDVQKLERVGPIV